MGKPDSYTKEFMKDNHIFAEVYNFLLGKKVVDPDKLSPIDVEELYTTTKLLDDTDRDVQKFRDVMKKYATAMTDGEASYVLLGVENQTLIDYAMPARIMVYDAMRYYKQLQAISARHRKAMDTESSEEFVAGFASTDRLKPVITVVVYYGSKRWNAPCDLYGLLDSGYEGFKPLMNNYRIRVFEASTIGDDELKKLETELRCVMSFIKNSRDKEKLDKIINEDEGFKRLDKLSVCVINAVTDSKIEINEKEETVDMCQAMKDIRHESMLEGEARGIALGETRGEANEKRKFVMRMMKDGVPLELIAKYSELSIDEIKKLSSETRV